MSPAVELGDAIKKARAQRGWDAGDLIRAMGGRWPVQSVWHWESGKGVGWSAVLDIVSALPELGDLLVVRIRAAQHRRGAQPPPGS